MPKGKEKPTKPAGPLESQLTGDMDAGVAKASARRGKRDKASLALHDEDAPAYVNAETGGDEFLSSKISQRIMDEARMQRVEEEGDLAGASHSKRRGVRFGAATTAASSTASARHGTGTIAAAVIGRAGARAGAGDDASDDEDADAVVEFDAHDGA